MLWVASWDKLLTLLEFISKYSIDHVVLRSKAHDVSAIAPRTKLCPPQSDCPGSLEQGLCPQEEAQQRREKMWAVQELLETNSSAARVPGVSQR